ncbi:ADP-ribose pyrophosphatase YjhB (NUDIX family) [Mucilaginibacter gracilis]|uniref:ADP-ribose pyrophosphatase YjhB (NUDIX family) n=1 Tax=Mucilaginibacter gracilis TaxID=423350 RepID=A0A495J528_9SPHI|nr:NUDIX hydrolase [Mucilaginibacter gracilis]RKR83454.1 ADP-ribose pyrophosphatase YjhB (NUDIX family) [Mucilaginibacter gracilis]
MPSTQLLNIAKRLKTMSHLGLTYANNDYDIERYKELEQISLEMMHLLTEHPLQALALYFNDKKEYITPKVDIRAVIFNEHKEILLVKEKADGKWSLPGGWADIGLSPTEIAVKEALEETGFTVEAKKLLAVLDKRCHPHPPQLDYVYKIFIQCEIVGGAYVQAFDILEVAFFAQNAIPELSIDRVLPSHIDLMFEYLNDADKAAVVD